MRIWIYFLAICLMCLIDNAIAQEYRFHHYRVEQGLPSDVVKAVTQDSLGFFWIATDDGLVKYDGVRFTTYKDAVPGQYVKGFLHTRDGKLLAFGDLNVVEIVNKVDTVIFPNYLRGERFISDSTVYFPKSIYQDRAGSIWLGEPKSVVKAEGKKIKRYDLGEENRSTVFVRSFSFFEDAMGALFVIAYNGNLFKYNSEKDTFDKIQSALAESVSHVLMVDNKLLIAARSGLIVSDYDGTKFSRASNGLPIGHVSHLLQGADASIYVSTYADDLYKISLGPQLKWENMFHNFGGINSTYLSTEGDLWSATDKGVVLVQKNLFVLGDQNSQSHFIESIAFDDNREKLYYCNKEVLVELTKHSGKEWQRNKIDERKDHYFQSLQFDGANLWASSRWEVLLFRGAKPFKKFDFSNLGNFVHDLFLDSKGNIWLSQAGTTDMKMIDKNFDINIFKVEGLYNKDINVAREGKGGIYLASSGPKGYLYFKAHGERAFTDISLPLTFGSGSDFNINDMAIDSHDNLWLATSEGLLVYNHKTISRLEFEREFQNYPVGSVEVLDAENILFCNSFGLFRYNIGSGEYWLYDENTGLPSNTISHRGIFVTPGKHVWLGTSYGLAYAEGSLLERKVTPTPYCIEARVNGVPTRFFNGVTAPDGAFLTLKFSPVSFPENRIIIQWRYANEENWHSLANQQLELSNLTNGNYTIEFRAKKNTGYSWSKIGIISINILRPYWKKPFFAVSLILLVSLISWGSYTIGAIIMNRRREFLENQIAERTQELTIANDELKQRNAELDRFVYSASHDLSAPLKSILGLIQVAKMDNPAEGHKEYLDLMERSVHKLESFIQEVVTYSRNARMPLNFEAIPFKPFVEGLLQDHEYSENFDRIKFIIEDSLGVPIITDVIRMKIILNNLLSNAIKFQWTGDDRVPTVRISLQQIEKKYILKVSDNGKGISEDHIKRIFEMFYRAAEDAQGSGLGLYILKESVLKLGGSVEAESKLHLGSTFIVKLPMPEPAPPNK